VQISPNPRLRTRGSLSGGWVLRTGGSLGTGTGTHQTTRNWVAAWRCFTLY